MKTFRLFSIAALALVMAACSSDDNMLETQSPAANGKLRFTATIATPGNGSGTRTVYTEQTTDGTINVAWKENDKIAAIVINSENKHVKTELTVSKVNDDGSAVISGVITKPKDDALTVDLIYPADIVTVAADGSDYNISFDKMSDGTTLDGTLKSIYENIDYRKADDCKLTVSGEQATLTSAAKLESKLSILKLTLQDKDENALLASKVAIAGGTSVLASATLTSAASEVYLPVRDVSGADICIAATTSSNNYFYMKEDVTLAAKQYYQSTVKMTKGAHLAFLTDEYEAKDGEILTGTLASNVKISIAAPVAPATTTTVTLKDVNINGSGTWTTGDYAGITCEGSATINLEGENKVKGFYEDYPGIYVPENKTLIIQGTGSLDASSNSSNSYGAGIGSGSYGTCGNITIKGGTVTATGGYYAAGIGGGAAGSCGNITINGGTVEAFGGFGAAGIGGGGYESCGNIEISGGTVTATGGYEAAGIGSGSNGICGNITISGGTVTATGGEQAAGIGGGYEGTCGTITITSGVTQVTAKKGSLAPRSIGAGDGDEGTCGTVTIGGTEYASGISQSPYEYSAPALSAATTSDVGKVVCAAGHLHDAKTAVPDGCTAVGILGKVTTTGHGLILALKDATSQDWSTINGWTSVTTYASTTLKVLPDDAARGTNLTSYTKLGETTVSNWAVAQKSDYEAIFINLGSTKSDIDGTTYDGNVNAYITTGVGGTARSGSYWSATENFGSIAWIFGAGCWDGGYKLDNFNVWPVLGF